MSEFVTMTHPDLDEHEPAKTTREAFDAVYADKGWQLVESDEAPAAKAAQASKSVTKTKTTEA